MCSTAVLYIAGNAVSGDVTLVQSWHHSDCHGESLSYTVLVPSFHCLVHHGAFVQVPVVWVGAMTSLLSFPGSRRRWVVACQLHQYYVQSRHASASQRYPFKVYSERASGGCQSRSRQRILSEWVHLLLINCFWGGTPRLSSTRC